MFWRSRARNSEVTDLIRSEFELVRDFRHLLVTSKFDKDPITKKERASLETPFSCYKSMGNFFRCSRAPYSVGSGPIWLKFELVREFMPVLVTFKFAKKHLIKNSRENVETSFPSI